MRPRRSQRNLRGSTAQDPVSNRSRRLKGRVDNQKVLLVKGSKQSCWLMDSAADVHVSNDLRLMTDFKENPTRVGGSTSDGISPGRGNVKIRLAKEDGSEGLILTLRNVFYLPNSPSNFVSLGLLNDIPYNDDERVCDSCGTIGHHKKEQRASFHGLLDVPSRCDGHQVTLRCSRCNGHNAMSTM